MAKVAWTHDKDGGLQNTERAVDWNISSVSRKPERRRKHWQERNDWKDVGLTWDETGISTLLGSWPDVSLTRDDLGSPVFLLN